MTKGLLILNLLAVLHINTVLSYSEQKYPEVILYDNPSCSLRSISILGTYNEPSLGNLNFNHPIEGFNFYGTWILYEHANFNTGDFNAEFVVAGNDYFWTSCKHYDWTSNSRVGSLRIAGHPKYLGIGAVTLYEQKNFGAGQEMLLEDTPVINLEQTRSLIITGTSDWTLYNETDFMGFNICMGRINVYYPTILADFQKDYYLPYFNIRSARTGYHCRNRKVAGVSEEVTSEEFLAQYLDG